MTTNDSAAGESAFSVSRTMNAPVARAWDAWRDPELIRRWWGPAGFTATVADVDFREGGRTLVGMRMGEGPEMCNTWTYTAIDEHRRIEFVSRFADRSGAEVDPGQVGLPPELPREVRHVVVFAPAGDGGTEVTVEEYGYAPGPMLEQSRLGQEQVMDKMAALFA
ncbi:MAG TPA: SRPBCC domain-containing protein [Glycomyces sp.]|nr:SRPBCC domain-containing protein [Glycomyces sp.]